MFKCSVQEALGTISAWELFTLWPAYYLVEPFGDDWLQTGVLATAAVAPYAKRGSRPKPSDFIPSTVKATTDWGALESQAKTYTATRGGTIK